MAYLPRTAYSSHFGTVLLYQRGHGEIGPLALLAEIERALILNGQLEDVKEFLVSLKERRISRRFLMRLPLTVRWTDENVVGEAATESREVSSRGLYFHLPKSLRSGSPVEIVMTLPHELTQAGPVRVRCLGRVLRSSPEHSGEVGVAAAIERYEFMRNGEHAA